MLVRVSIVWELETCSIHSDHTARMVRFSVIYQGTQEVKATDLEGGMNYIEEI